jgi:hypothetical protein
MISFSNIISNKKNKYNTSKFECKRGSKDKLNATPTKKGVALALFMTFLFI